jgi:hypothetical protein
VVAATVPCQHRAADIDAMCMHGFGGSIVQEPLERFTASDIRHMDEALTEDEHFMVD